MARRWPRHHGIKQSGCGRLPAVRRACSKATPRTSMAWPLRRTAARWSASATTRAFGPRRWNAATGEPVDSVLVEKAGDPLATYASDRGAEIFRACVACHTLGADQANRAGPTLAGLFGRRIATAPGYNFSDALKRLDIVW